MESLQSVQRRTRVPPSTHDPPHQAATADPASPVRQRRPLAEAPRRFGSTPALRLTINSMSTAIERPRSAPACPALRRRSPGCSRPAACGEGWSTLGRVLRRQVAHDVVDRQEAGVLREQVVLQAQLGDALALAVAAFQRFLVGRASDAMARPQVAQRGRVLARCARRRRWRCGTGRARSGLRSRPGRALRRAICRTRRTGPLAQHVGQLRPARRRTRPGLRSAP